MKTTLYSILLILGSVFLFTQCDKKEDPMNQAPLNNKKALESCVTIQELWAGAGQNDLSKGTLVGTVTASFESEDVLVITYNVNPGWDLSEAHVWVGNDFSSIPQKAAPGLFPYATYSAPWEFQINLSDLGIEAGDPIYVAAHGVVCAGEGIDLAELPETVPYSVSYPGDRSYFKTTVGGESDLAGLYDGWCIQTGQRITPGTDYIAVVYSSLDMIPEGLVDYPENFDLVNWLINQDLIGNPSTGCDGNYTWGDIQMAIWKLLIADPEPSGLGEYSDCRADEIVALAQSNGQDFIPECGDKFAIILENESHQNTIIEIPMPCMDCETAWAFGAYTFIDLNIAKNWGWIFEINCD